MPGVSECNYGRYLGTGSIKVAIKGQGNTDIYAGAF